MDGSFPRKPHCDGYSSDPQSEQHQLPCAACRDCRSIHGLAPSSQGCVLKGCYVCADLSRINDEISSTYQRLSDLVKEPQKSLENPRHDTLIYHMPVEILASIFFFVEEDILSGYYDRYEDHPDHGPHEPAYQQLIEFPPLLLGAVCKRWREITLETPQLWTNITVDLAKPTDGQFDMVKKWACRSGVLPLNITVFPGYKFAWFDQHEDLITALRSLVVRWKDVALNVPAVICHALLENLPEAPRLSSVFFPAMYDNLEPIGMQDPLRPRRLLCKQIPEEIPFGWGRLVFLDVERASDDEILHVIRHAPNLRHCIAERGGSASGKFPMPTSPITNCSLIVLERGCATSDIVHHLTLPSLLHLDCGAMTDAHGPHDFDFLMGFLDRSSAPLTHLFLRCYGWGWDHFPTSLERLAGITRLSLNGEPFDPAGIDNFFHALIQPSPTPILPRLTILEMDLPRFSASLWSLFTQVFPTDTQTNSSGLKVLSEGSIAIKRPLSWAFVRVNGRERVSMDKDTFLRLLEIRNSGVHLLLSHGSIWDLFHYMAQVYDIKL